jgi:hypothetical protein
MLPKNRFLGESGARELDVTKLFPLLIITVYSMGVFSVENMLLFFQRLQLYVH